MTAPISPSKEALSEATALASEILTDLELSRIPLVTATLRAARLARLLNDFDLHQILLYEASGYPAKPDGVPPEPWRLAQLAGRTYEWKDPSSSETKTVAFLDSVEQLQHEIDGAKLALQAAADHDVSISSANPNQFLFTPTGNFAERQGLLGRIATASQHLGSRRAFIHDYVSRRYYELRYSGLAQDIFSAIRQKVDAAISSVVPSAVQKLVSVHDNLRSENPEDWSNAVHSCRRVLQDLADTLFPPQDQPRIAANGTEIALGPDNFINRLVCYAEDHSQSARFNELVGSHLHYLGDRLDSVFRAAQKGSHAVVGREEANRYVVYTYMLVGDLLSLHDVEAAHAA
ncbi:MAG: hypothetical protein ABSG98_06220 [Anaerolineales bacterium]|jgi:hypothetical protein